ncbi:hypothetical protein EYC80_006562 [Monilinia laxa]|uniref:Uncharacterized protein n=1 Tax=Monilinia laxa TaxID=61186 RepID=A0A5N6JTR4_MONLA|nr:hypothetical protein EYC80_006562 [Monilinia laxa]
MYVPKPYNVIKANDICTAHISNRLREFKRARNPPLTFFSSRFQTYTTFSYKNLQFYQKTTSKISINMPFEQPVVEQQIQSEAPMSSENVGIEMQQPKPVPAMGTETNLRGGESAGCECCGCGCGEQCC